MTPGLSGSSKGRREIPAQAQEIKALISSAPPEKTGIGQACCTHVLTLSVLPTRLKIGKCGTICLHACTITPCVCACSHTQPTRGSGCPAEPCTHPTPACATVGLPVHPPACARARGCAPRGRTPGLRTQRCVFTCAVVCVCVSCVHTHACGGAPRCEWVWACVGGQHVCGLVCVVPRHQQMVPCLHITFQGPKPAPCGGTWGDTALAGVMTLPSAGPWVLGLSSQAETLTTARGG